MRERVLEQWIEFKETAVAFAPLHRDALHLLVGFVAVVIFAALFRRSTAHPLPWLALAVIWLANEAVNIFADSVVEEWELRSAANDTTLILLLPTLLLLVSRYSRVFERVPRLMPEEPPAEDHIVEVEFEEVFSRGSAGSS